MLTFRIHPKLIAINIDMLYLTNKNTIKHPDQFGGEKGKKFLYSRFKNLLTDISQQPMTKQALRMDEVLKNWMGMNEQVDDILVMGVRF